MQGQGLYKQQKARQEEETGGSSVGQNRLLGQKRPLESFTEEVLADQQDLRKMVRTINSKLDQLEEEQKSDAKMRWWSKRILFAGAHASLVA